MHREIRCFVMCKEEIINRISKARTKANLSARALSCRIGMNPGYINRLESKRDFLPSTEAMLKIIEECGLTEVQFFYYDIDAYEKDKNIIEILSTISSEKKDAIITLLTNNKLE